MQAGVTSQACTTVSIAEILRDTFPAMRICSLPLASPVRMQAPDPIFSAAAAVLLAGDAPGSAPMTT
jgi:hypothetical protein